MTNKEINVTVENVHDFLQSAKKGNGKGFKEFPNTYLQCYRLLEMFEIGKLVGTDFKYNYRIYNNEDLRYVYPNSTTLVQNGAKLMNSSYAINNVFGPFCRSVVLIIAVLLVFIILLHINKKLINKGIIFKNAKVILNIVEVFILAFTIIIAVYGKVDNFDYTKYGIQVQDIESALEEGNIENIALREVPSIHSIRRNTSEDTVGYKVISELSEWAYFLSDNFELFIALAAAVIVPFKKYTEKINI